MDAVVRTGGKQYRVHEGSVLNVATIDAEPGSQIELSDILLVTDGPNITIGDPNVEGAIVVADVVEHGKGKKVVNFKYKAKVRYRRKRGHRQPFTTLSVREIRIGGVSSSTTAAPRRRTRAAPAVDEPATEAPEAPVAEVTETPSAEAPRRRSRATPKTDAPATETPATEGDAPAPRPRRRRTTSSETESQD